MYLCSPITKQGSLDEWLSQRSAKPCTAVRIRQEPQKSLLNFQEAFLFVRPLGMIRKSPNAGFPPAGEQSAPQMFPNCHSAASGEHLHPFLCPKKHFQLPGVIFRDLCGIFVEINSKEYGIIFCDWTGSGYSSSWRRFCFR